MLYRHISFLKHYLKRKRKLNSTGFIKAQTAFEKITTDGIGAFRVLNIDKVVGFAVVSTNCQSAVWIRDTNNILLLMF